MDARYEHIEWQLVHFELMSADDAAAAVSAAREAGEPLWEHVIRRGLIDARRLGDRPVSSLPNPAIDLDSFQVPDEAAGSFPGDLAEFYGVVPLGVSTGTLVVAVPSLDDAQTLHSVAVVTGRALFPIEVDPAAIRAAIARVYGR